MQVNKFLLTVLIAGREMFTHQLTKGKLRWPIFKLFYCINSTSNTYNISLLGVWYGNVCIVVDISMGGGGWKSSLRHRFTFAWGDFQLSFLLQIKCVILPFVHVFFRCCINAQTAVMFRISNLFYFDWIIKCLDLMRSLFTELF